MKNFSKDNYTRHKTDIAKTISRIEGKMWDEYTNEELVQKFMPLVEHLAKKFSTTEQASGVLSILDLMQYGYIGLINAVERVDRVVLVDSKDPEKTLKTFLSKRVKGAIRRAINNNRGAMKIPEYVLNELRGLELDEHEYDPKVLLFFSQIFDSTDSYDQEDSDGFNPYDVADTSPAYKIDVFNAYLMGIMKKYLTQTQRDVLRMSYGLDCVKMSAIHIAAALDMNMATANVRVSQIKKDAIDTLVRNVKPEEIFEL